MTLTGLLYGVEFKCEAICFGDGHRDPSLYRA